MPADTPVNEAMNLLRRGLTNEEIASNLEAKGYNLQQISDAINQAKIKQGVEGTMPENMQESIIDQEIPGPPEEQMIQQPQYQQQSYMPPAQQTGASYEEIQALVEQVVEEKWKELMRDVGDVAIFKARMIDDVEAVKQEILRTQRRLDDLQMAIMGKVKEYNQSVLSISSEMKALEQVFGKIIEPLASNVKELSRITEELKK